MVRTERILALEPDFRMRPQRPRVRAAEIIQEQAVLKRESVELENIQSDMIEAAGLVLPDAIIEQFGFDAMHWQLVLKQNAMSAIYLGSTNKHGIYPLEEAEGVIVINAESSRIPDSEESKITPSSISLAGTIRDSSSQKRATELAFNVAENDLYYALVSVSDTEFRPARNREIFIHDVYDNYKQITEYVPTTAENNKYHIKGYITPAMTALTEGHTSGVRVSKPRTEYPLWIVPFVDYPNPGITYKESDDSFQISFDPKNRRDSRLVRVSDSPVPAIPKWDLLLPKHLEG